MDPPQVKAKPISDSDSAFGIMYIRRGKKKKGSETAVKREEWDDEREITLQTLRSVKKEGGGGARDIEAEIFPLPLMMNTTVGQAVFLQPMEVHGGADLHL